TGRTWCRLPRFAHRCRTADGVPADAGNLRVPRIDRPAPRPDRRRERGSRVAARLRAPARRGRGALGRRRDRGRTDSRVAGGAAEARGAAGMEGPRGRCRVRTTAAQPVRGARVAEEALNRRVSWLLPRVAKPRPPAACAVPTMR